MKKAILLSIIAVFTAVFVASANPVDVNVARTVGAKFLSANTKVQLRSNDLQLAKTYNINRGDAAFYVFNAPNGFVIVAGDDCAYPILGYSDSGHQFDINNIPIQLQDVLQEYQDQIQYAIENNLVADAKTAEQWQLVKATGKLNNNRDNTQVGPLLTTTWDQGQYYNAMCPEDENGPDGHAVTGCVATAMAQIIKYNGYPQHGRGIHSYNSDYGILSVNYAESNYDYANMPDALTNESSDAQVNAVAKLISDCGVAVNMGYSPGESSAYDQEARAALINFFRYSPNLSFAEKFFFDADEWADMLRADLDANRPVYYSGKGTGGHAFVCDGYNSDGYFSFNFGWSGAGNDWYLLDAINPLGMNFNSDQAAILGIVPDANGNVIIGQMSGTSTFTVYEPLEFYHIMGHNLYEGANYINPCNNTVYFIPADETNQMVVDIMEYEDQNLTINDGNGAWLRSFLGGENNDMSPVVSTANAISIAYSGNLYYAGFKLSVSQDTGCRMVSNIISSIEATTVHLTWTENGDATQWQIEYGIKGFELGEGTVYNTTTNTVTFENLEKFTEYDFYIRPVCGDNQYGLWNKVTLMVEAEYWQDVVTSQPEGYSYNQSLNRVEISSAEGLAWWAKTDNQNDVILMADINLSGYKWRPVEGHNFDGNGHVINNAYIVENSSYVGFFSYLLGDCMDLGLVNFYVKSTGNNIGGLCGQFGLSNSAHGTLLNCYVSNGTVIGADYVGGLVGFAQECTILNCYSNVSVIGNRWTGLMVGAAEHQVIKNSYSTGSVRLLSYCYYAGIVGYISTGTVDHCYSIELPMGVVGYSGSTVIADTSSFYEDNGVFVLKDIVTFDGEYETELMGALNKGVEMTNDENWRVWVADTNNLNNGYPIFGSYYNVTCINVDSLFVSNIKINSVPCVVVSWIDTSFDSQYEIRYLRKDAPLDSMVTTSTINHSDTLYGIPLGYVYDFSVRSVCDDNTHSAWTTTQVIVDLPYWTDIVTSQPSGYVEDSNGNIEISSAEGLAWLSVLCNGLHGQSARTFEGKQITLTADISLEGYRWRPIGENKRPNWCYFSGSFDGNNHYISDIYILDSRSFHGLFGLIFSWSEHQIKNVNMVGGSVSSIIGSNDYEGYSTNQSCIGGLAGQINRAAEVSNCHSSVDVSGLGAVGSLIGSVHVQEGSTNIYNCFAIGDVFGREKCGGLIGDCYGRVTVENSYAQGDVHLFPGGINAWYRGGLIGNFQCNASVYNCYATGVVDVENTIDYGKLIGSAYTNPHIHYIYGDADSNHGMGLYGGYCEDVSDTTQFHHNGISNTLTTPITINNETYSDLTNALNAWVSNTNDPKLKTWVLDSTLGYPVFGDFYEPSCYNPEDLSVVNATVIGDSIIRTQLSWIQEGEPSGWEVLYVASQHSIDSGTIVSVAGNPCVLTGIPIGSPLDFYVRAVCDSNDISGWSNKVTYIPDKPRWTEVVTSQPEGYVEDANNNIFISTAEGLAWLSSVANSLNGAQNNLFDKRVILTNDVDMSTYRWTPIITQHLCFNGISHTISGIYVNELQNNIGFIGAVYGGEINNITITDCSIKGFVHAGGLAGNCVNTRFSNCFVSGNVSAIMSIGGLVGLSNYSSIINTSFIGNIEARNDITSGDATRGFLGGILSGSYYDTIINNYIVCEVPEEMYSAILIGSEVSSIIPYNYCLYYPTNLPFTSYNITDNLSFFSGSGTTWTLNTPPYVNGEFRTDLLDALNAWVDANNTNGEYLHWVADTGNENGGFPMLERQPATTAQISSLTNGWNWWSTYIEQEGFDGLTMLENALGANGENIKSQSVFVKRRANGTWMGQLTSLTNEDGYKISVTSDCTVAMLGAAADPGEHPITIKPNWTWIGYPLDVQQTVSVALSGFEPVVGDIIKGAGGFAKYRATGWMPSNFMLEPGKSYMYSSGATENKTLVYSNSRSNMKAETEEPHWQTDRHAYADNLTMIAVVKIEGEEQRDESCEVGAFVNGECRGSAKLMYDAETDRYLAMLTISGEDGDVIDFGVTNGGRQMLGSETRIRFTENAMIGDFTSPKEIRFGAMSDQSITIYPNPVGKDMPISLTLPTDDDVTEIVITDMLGVVVRHETANGKEITGISKPGVYMIRTVCKSGKVYNTRIIVK